MRAAHKDWYSNRDTGSSLSGHVRGKLRASLIVLWSAVDSFFHRLRQSRQSVVRTISLRGPEFATRAAPELAASHRRPAVTESVVFSREKLPGWLSRMALFHGVAPSLAGASVAQLHEN
jgi:hypothetical protein